MPSIQHYLYHSVRTINDVFVEYDDFKACCLVCPQDLGSTNAIPRHSRSRKHVARLALYDMQKRAGAINAAEFPGVPVDGPAEGEGDAAGSVARATDQSPEPDAGRPESPPAAPLGELPVVTDTDIQQNLDLHQGGVRGTGEASPGATGGVGRDSGSAPEAYPATDSLALSQLLKAVHGAHLPAVDARASLLSTPAVEMPATVKASILTATGATAADFESDEEYAPPYLEDMPEPGPEPRPSSTTAFQPEDLVWAISLELPVAIPHCVFMCLSESLCSLMRPSSSTSGSW